MNGTWKVTGPGRGTWQTAGGGGGLAASLAAMAAVVAVCVVAMDWLARNWAVALGAVGALAVLGVLLVPVLRWARRFSVATVSTAAVIARQDAAPVPARARARELAGQRRALEAPPRVVVLPAGDYAERARRVR